MKIIDISMPISTQLPIWEGTPRLSVTKSSSIAEGKMTNDSVLYMGVHTGTHVDAPLHFLPQGSAMQDMDLQSCIGKASVVEFLSKQRITAKDLDTIPTELLTERLLLKTDNTQLWQRKGEFVKDFTAITADAAQWLVDKGVKLIGIDYLSIQLYGDAPDTHLILLRNNVVILEGLNLGHVPQGVYQLICLPLNITGAEAAPARAVLVDMF